MKSVSMWELARIFTEGGLAGSEIEGQVRGNRLPTVGDDWGWGLITGRDGVHEGGR